MFYTGARAVKHTGDPLELPLVERADRGVRVADPGATVRGVVKRPLDLPRGVFGDPYRRVPLIDVQPFDLADPRGSLPNLPQWHGAVESMIARSTVKEGVGYLTIDEAEVREGETHRRPGAHVDGVGPGGLPGGWGGGGPWGACGMLVAASVRGCRGWRQSFDGEPGPDGDCAHLLEQVRDDARIDMESGHLYWCGPLAVHESTPMRETGRRQFARVSMPSAAPWFSGYTPSPVGIQPTGPILPRRAGMDYRA